MFHVTVSMVFSTGGWKHDPHHYYFGQGVGMSRSPKTALRLAEDRAYRAAGEGVQCSRIHYKVTYRKV